MSIDKSLKQHYEVTASKKKKIKGEWHKLAYITPKEAKLLQKSGGVETRTPEGLFAYPGGAGTPGGYDGGSGSSSGGGGGGGGEGGHHVDTGAARRADAARAAAAASAAEQARTDALNASRARAADEARETAREKAIQVAALTTKTPTRSPHKDTQEQIIEQKILDDYGYQDLKAQAPTTFKPKIEEYITHSPFTDEPIINERLEKYSPTYYQDRSKIGGETWGERAEAGIKRGGIGTTLKNIALGVVAPQLLAGTKLAMPYKMYKGYQTAKKYVPKIGDIETALKSNLTNKYITKKTKTDTQEEATKKLVSGDTRDGEGGTIQQAVTGGKDVVTESMKQFTGTTDEQAEFMKRRNTVQGILDQGSYQGKELTEQQRNSLMNYIEQISKFLVDPMEVAYGGRIDKALGGRSRDIG